MDIFYNVWVMSIKFDDLILNATLKPGAYVAKRLITLAFYYVETACKRLRLNL